jgi:hypothetical protein
MVRWLIVVRVVKEKGDKGHGGERVVRVDEGGR